MEIANMTSDDYCIMAIAAADFQFVNSSLRRSNGILIKDLMLTNSFTIKGSKFFASPKQHGEAMI